MISEVQIDNFPNQNIRVSIPDGSFVTIGLKYSYNKYADNMMWTLTLFDNEGVVVCAGRRIKPNVSILTGGLLPNDGNFIAVPISKPAQELGMEPWGNTHALLFMDNL